MAPIKRFQKKGDVKRPTNPRVVGTSRNEFGTRLSQRIECEKCQKVDYVPVKVGAQKVKLCRDCAEKFLLAFDQGRTILEKQVSCVCEQCRRDFTMSEALSKKKEQLLCSDCFRGFDVWRGKACEKSAKTKTRLHLTKIGSNTTFRKIADDSI